MKVNLSVIALFVWLPPAMAGVQPRTQVCNFDGDNATRVYKVATAPGVGTTFRLPEGWKINDFVVADPKAFHAESNGTIGIVTPLAPNKSTSVSIYTENDKLFVFNLSSDPDPAGFVDQLVVVESTNLQFFNQKVQTEARRLTKNELEAAEARCSTSLGEKAREVREQLLFSINNNYEIRDRSFSITKVSDDGIFTYIQLAKTYKDFYLGARGGSGRRNEEIRGKLGTGSGLPGGDGASGDGALAKPLSVPSSNTTV